jgi:hypothetical protein
MRSRFFTSASRGPPPRCHFLVSPRRAAVRRRPRPAIGDVPRKFRIVDIIIFIHDDVEIVNCNYFWLSDPPGHFRPAAALKISFSRWRNLLRMST